MQEDRIGAISGISSLARQLVQVPVLVWASLHDIAAGLNYKQVLRQARQRLTTDCQQSLLKNCGRMVASSGGLIHSGELSIIAEVPLQHPNKVYRSSSATSRQATPKLLCNIQTRYFRNDGKRIAADLST